jgi:thymidylate synthase
MPYLLTDTIAPKELYTYGSRLQKQFIAIINLLKNTPNTNQAVLQIAETTDYALEDPPCLRHIDLRIMEGKLHVFPYFRSNDLWSGLPVNLASIAIMQKWLADDINVEVGEMIYSSKGLHLYKFVEELAKLRTNKS